ncbi:MAG: MBL fold metallo-hydrolase [Firmicutes bacterium]|nr:MBL fold metallo-hydrolase [Bacillota bacterium]
MSIQYPVVSEIAYKTWCINEFGMDAMFLIEGDEKALLIDTGTGTFDLKTLVSQLTNKEVIVALTHGHVDHAGGIKQFKDIYLHEDDYEMASNVSLQDRQEYADLLINMSEGVFEPVTCIDWKEEPAFHPLKEGDVFELGNRDVVVYETPGHTQGSISFLDCKQRILFSGDACNPNTLLLDTYEKNSISTLKNSAQKMLSLQQFFDRHFNGHIGYAGFINFSSLPDRLIEDAIVLADKISSGEDKGEVVDNPFGGQCLLSKYGTLQIQYKKENVR